MSDRVHAPLVRWARERGAAIAISDGNTALSFAELNAAVEGVAASLADAPATVLLDDRQSTLQRLVEFLGIVASGRCAAVGDPDWPRATRDSVRAALAALPAHLPQPASDAPFYIGFTSGSTGTPKGFRRDHRSWVESFRVCLETFGSDAATCVLAPGRLSHSLFLFGMLLGLWSGAGVVVQERFSAARALADLKAGRTRCLVAVPSQLVMLLEHARRRGMAPIDAVGLILISGARWMRERTAELKALFPQARVVEFYGASETSFVAWMEADPAAPSDAVGWPFSNVQVDIRPLDSPAGPGLIFVRSPMLFSDYVGGANDATAAVRDGDWLSVRDLGRIDAEGRLRLAGRQNRMIVTQGKNLFPEEVEAELAARPDVLAASVHGLADPVRGQQVVAVLHLAPGAAPNAAAMAAACRNRLEAYKVPRQFLVCADWPQTLSGKTDHVLLGRWLQAGDSPCLSPLS
ncbi:MAG: AMP-binding protein [Burkholderiaceae bacterium]